MAGEKSDAGAQGKADPWEKMRFFVGSWEGTGKGTPGTSRIKRHYEFILKGQFLSASNTATFAPQEKNPKGETHEDLGIIGYDGARGKFVVREFHGEGYFNRYVLEDSSDDGKTMVFTTESIENGPPGMRARITLRVVNDNEFTETFELAFSGGELEPCVQATLKRNK